MIETKVEKPEEAPKAESGSARSALSEGRIDVNASEIINRIHRLTTLQLFMPMLKYRLAATAMICNKNGILGGQAGSNNASPVLKPTDEKYRTSEDPKGPPTISLPLDTVALQNEARISQAAPDYGESSLFTGFKNYDFDETPIDSSPLRYENLTGPPTAPHYENSHVITNYSVYGSDEASGFTLECGWEGIKSRQRGEFFESQLINNENGRDLRGATQYDQDQFSRQVMAWGNHIGTGSYDV